MAGVTPGSSGDCLFVLRLNFTVNNFAVMWRRSHTFLGINQYSGELMCLAKGHYHGPLDSESDALPLCHCALLSTDETFTNLNLNDCHLSCAVSRGISPQNKLAFSPTFLRQSMAIRNRILMPWLYYLPQALYNILACDFQYYFRHGRSPQTATFVFTIHTGIIPFLAQAFVVILRQNHAEIVQKLYGL